MSIDKISGLSQLIPTNVGLNSVDTKKTDSEISFGEYLNSALSKVTELDTQSGQLKQDFALGKTDSIHEVMIASEKAGIALQLTMQIRNKVLDAYTEIMRMQI